jgi:hypothetical protein
MPATATILKHFGTYRQLYERVGYHLDAEDIFRGEKCELSLKLRRAIVNKITNLFTDNVVATHLPNRTRSMLLVDGSVMVSLLLCRVEKRGGGRLHWVVKPIHAEGKYITLLCTMNRACDRFSATTYSHRWIGRNFIAFTKTTRGSVQQRNWTD